MLRAARGKGGGLAQTALLDPGASRADSAGTKAGTNAGSGAGVKADPKSASTSVLGVRVPESKN
jgi:hypothetical protein